MRIHHSNEAMIRSFLKNARQLTANTEGLNGLRLYLQKELSFPCEMLELYKLDSTGLNESTDKICLECSIRKKRVGGRVGLYIPCFVIPHTGCTPLEVLEEDQGSSAVTQTGLCESRRVQQWLRRICQVQNFSANIFPGHRERYLMVP